MSAPISLPQITRTLLNRWRFIVAAGVLGFLFALTVVVVPPRVYQSTVTVAGVDPTGSDSRLMGLASQFGLADLAGSRSSGIVPTPDFVGQLAHSTLVLDRLLDHAVSTGEGGSKVALIDLIEPGKAAKDPRSTSIRRNAAVRKLRSLVLVRKNKLTNSTTLGVKLRWPIASRDAVIALVGELNRVFLELRRSQAEEERRFSVGRIADRQQSLRAAEDHLSQFLLRNREYRNSPVLVADYERLQREVTTQSQVLTGLMQSFEEANLRAARDTPLLLVVEPAAVPVDPQSRHLVVTVFLGAVAAGLVATLIVLMQHGRARAVA